ncbi:MAG: hypothetical protein AVDCRST_MAG56-3446 [uncultured Cytophagales bacterium]|uniref:Outer membrane efflux protein n=1 Tax=uncultured Cytophagales bacterium TaxID=158755 RepID=A0A6J4JCD9_9SPHI|nr:MAG: hypothetical protein AVDCRST_MAG56-3446 [uncultured Cytophagales bacterium]
MNAKTYFCCLCLWAGGHAAYGQSGIACNLENLTELTLAKSPLIQLNRLEIDRSKANLQVQTSAFDYQTNAGIGFNHNRSNLFASDPRRSIMADPLRTNTTDFTGSLQRRLRSGLVASVSADYTRLSHNFPRNQFNEEVSPYLPDHSASAMLSLTQPLLRGRGGRIATAAERASSMLVESAQSEFVLNSSYQVLQTGIAYWQYLNAHQRLAIFEENEARVRNVLQITEKLVEADKKPASDLVQIKADLAGQQRQTIVARQELLNTRINLGKVVGLDGLESGQLSVPLNEFPTLAESGFAETLSQEAMVAIARQHRSDLAAFTKAQEALKVQLDLARNNLKPQLDLSGYVGYGGSAVGNGFNRIYAPFINRQGRDVNTGFRLNFAFPLNNNLAAANFSQQKIALQNQLISYDNLVRNIDLNISAALNNLTNSVLVLQKARETLEYSQNVFENEQAKFQNGLTTILNLILFQERLTYAQLDYLQAQQQFAMALVNLRFETGTLLSAANASEAFSVRPDAFYTVPK